MDDRYNSNIYLETSDLNSIENSIYNITNDIQENIFNNQQSPLRNIQVGDNLNNRTVYLTFPEDIYESISGSDNKFIKTDNGNYFTFHAIEYPDVTYYRVYFIKNDISYTLYNKRSNNNYQIRLNKIKMDYNAGKVTEIDTNNDIYQYIKIYDDTTIIPNYVKHVWQDNEFLTMQKLDNIENGIKNIGYYYYKPLGWLETREWLRTLCINTQNISYRDLNRWINNLELINFDNLENMTIWNTDITQLEWNKNSNIEWEDL